MKILKELHFKIFYKYFCFIHICLNEKNEYSKKLIFLFNHLSGISIHFRYILVFLNYLIYTYKKLLKVILYSLKVEIKIE